MGETTRNATYDTVRTVGHHSNMLTAICLLLRILAAVITRGLLVIGGLLVLLAGTFDMFDGAMARVQNASTSFGAFFDSTLDRYSEGIILLGLLVYALRRSPDFKEPLWPTSHEQTWMILFLYMAMVGSFCRGVIYYACVSYTKARAEGLGVECHVGILARPERVVILALGLLSVQLRATTYRQQSTLSGYELSDEKRQRGETKRETPICPVHLHGSPFDEGCTA